MKEVLLTSRQMRKRRSMLRFFVAAILLLMASGGAVAAFYYEKWRVAEIAVVGNNMISREAITGFVRSFIDQKVFIVFPGDNILLVRKDRLTAGLAQAFPRFKEIIVSREGLNKLSIGVVEREAWGSYCLEQICYLIDKDGIIFAPSPAFEGNLFMRITDQRGGGVRMGAKVNANISFYDIKNKFEAVAGSVAEIVLISNNEWRVVMVGGWQAIVNEETDLAAAIKNLRVTLAELGQVKLKNLEYIDLRFGKKIFYKF